MSRQRKFLLGSEPLDTGTRRDRNPNSEGLNPDQSLIDRITRRDDQLDALIQFVLDNPGTEDMLPGFSGY
jgi:hypothetical protein